MNLGAIDYASAPPDAYACSSCGATGCKLWRQFVFCADSVDLLCADCGGKQQKVDVSSIDDRGRTLNPLIDDRSDQLGNLLPAVPNEAGTTFWGYTSIPQAGVDWWHRMPSRPLDAWVARLKHTLLTQDCAYTSHPMYVVQQRRRITGIDPEYTSDIVWIVDCAEVDDDEAAKLEEAYESTGEIPDDYTRTGYIDEWEYVTVFFTDEAAQRFIAHNAHRLREPRIYVDSAYRNDEWQKIRSYLSGRPS